MQLLDISLPSMTRMQFANQKSKEVWEPKIRMASTVYSKLEIETVKHDVRDCMLMHNVNPNNLDRLMQNLARDGMMLIPLQKEGAAGGGFGHLSGSYEGRGSYGYRALVTKSMQHAEEFIHAHEQHDDITIGKLLGFPACCSKFFDDVWQQGFFDPIWQQAEGTQGSEMFKFHKEIQDADGNTHKHLIRMRPSEDIHKINAVFRYIGVRFISHFACSFDCRASVAVAEQWMQVAKDLRLIGFNEAIEIMRLPFEWDCYKGVATINTPVFKISTSSMPCYPNHVIQQESDFYPEEAPTGIQFPWRYFRGRGMD